MTEEEDAFFAEFSLRYTAMHLLVHAMHLIAMGRQALIFALALFALAGTGSVRAEPNRVKAEDSQPVDQDYFPELAAGAEREFSLVITTGGDRQEGKLKIKIEEGMEIKGRKYLRQVSNVEGIPDVGIEAEYLRYAEDGFYVIEGGETKFPEHREMPRPVRVGQEWSYRSATGTASCKAEAMEDVKVGNQVFKKCLKVTETMEDEDGSKTITSTWYALKIGEVKITINNSESIIEALRVEPASN